MSDAAIDGMALLSARKLDIAVGSRRLADALDLDVHAGELWCLLGPNGSGKSTLLQTLAGLRTPMAGALTFDGRPWAAFRPHQAAKLRAWLPQQCTYAFSARVADSVMLGRHPHIGRWGRESEHDRRRVRAALAAMDLEPLAHRDVLSLSGGERQRVTLAAVLAQDAKLVLLDEPTAHLDLVHQAMLAERLCALTRVERRSVIFATHDFNFAARFATHACLLFGDGRVLSGPASRVLQAKILTEVFAFALEEHLGPQGPVLSPRW